MTLTVLNKLALCYIVRPNLNAETETMLFSLDQIQPKYEAEQKSRTIVAFPIEFPKNILAKMIR